MLVILRFYEQELQNLNLIVTAYFCFTNLFSIGHFWGRFSLEKSSDLLRFIIAISTILLKRYKISHPCSRTFYHHLLLSWSSTSARPSRVPLGSRGWPTSAPSSLRSFVSLPPSTWLLLASGWWSIGSDRVEMPTVLSHGSKTSAYKGNGSAFARSCGSVSSSAGDWIMNGTQDVQRTKFRKMTVH